MGTRGVRGISPAQCDPDHIAPSEMSPVLAKLAGGEVATLVKDIAAECPTNYGLSDDEFCRLVYHEIFRENAQRLFWGSGLSSELLDHLPDLRPGKKDAQRRRAHVVDPSGKHLRTQGASHR